MSSDKKERGFKMPEIVKILERIIPYIAIGLIIIPTIVILIILRFRDKKIMNLYMEGKYDKANQKLNSLKIFAFGAYKQWHYYYEALILIAKENYLLADEILKNIKYKKMEKPKLFWLCFIQINLGNVDLVNYYYRLFNKLSKNEELDNKIISSLIEHMHDNTHKIKNTIYKEIKNPVLIKYIKDNNVLN